MDADLKTDLLAFLAGSRLDFQEVRKMSGNRFRNLLRRRLEGINGVEAKREEGEEKEYGVWSDRELAEKLEEARKKGKLTSEELEFIEKISEMQKAANKEEKLIEKMFAKEVGSIPIYVKWLSKIKGIGATHAITLIAFMGDCSRFETRSKLNAYAGYHVKNGESVSMKKGEKINWNPKLKSRLFVLADNLIKANGKYKKFYDKKKALIKQKFPEIVEVEGQKRKKYTPLHIERMARRKMIQLFLSHYWQVSRKIAGLPTENIWAQNQEWWNAKQHHLLRPEAFTDR